MTNHKPDIKFSVIPKDNLPHMYKRGQKGGIYADYTKHVLKALESIGPYNVLKYEIPDEISIRGLSHELRKKLKDKAVSISASEKTKIMFIWKGEAGLP